MPGLNVFFMVIPPGSSHSFRLLVVRHNVATVGKFIVANATMNLTTIATLCRTTNSQKEWEEPPGRP